MTNNSANEKFTNNSDGFDLAGGTTARKLTLSGADVAIVGSGSAVITFPSATGTLATLAGTETLTNKTIDGVTPTVMGYVDPTSSIQTQLNAKGSGTVTGVSVATANGFSGSSSGGATPALTIVAGAITPTSINGLILSLGGGSISGNVAIGGTSLIANTTGYSNTAVGWNTLYNNNTGHQNVGLGYVVMGGVTSGSTNTGIGYFALNGITTGNGNVALGNTAGYNETGSNSLYINNIQQSSLVNDKAYSLIYGTFSGTAGSLSGQQLTINGNLTVNAASVLTATSPVFATPALGVATATSLQSNTLTATTNSSINLGSGSYNTIQTYTPTAGGTATLDLSKGNYHRITMPAGNVTIAISNGSVGQCFLLDIVQDSVGSRTVTYFTTIKWAGGSPPTLTTTANKIDTEGFTITSAGNYQGYVVGSNI